MAHGNVEFRVTHIHSDKQGHKASNCQSKQKHGGSKNQLAGGLANVNNKVASYSWTSATTMVTRDIKEHIVTRKTKTATILLKGFINTPRALISCMGTRLISSTT
jgi:hypothetical protein